MNTKMAASLITSMFGFLQVHSGKTTQLHSATAAEGKVGAGIGAGILALPNQCVREENMGSGLVIALNVENPSVRLSESLFSDNRSEITV